MAQGPHDDPERTELLATRSPAADAKAGDASTLPAGARLGRYRIEGLLGRGGMGEVYRAEQLEPVRRTVALKLLRAQKLDARHLAYFEVERQLLAQMRHPAIAQVFDADTTADGHPFFAMEFIAGSPITAYCDAHAMPTDARIALFIRVCEGVQHAHQKGVIHRDLKPGNLLVDEVDGRALPKIIDFGIATATSLTEGREVAGTPDYMSPEQAGGDQALVDTRSDVYALGVVLSELLTGRRPLPAGQTVTDHDRTLRLPSAQLSTLTPADAERLAKAHGEPVSRMRRVLQGELDWVVAKAMRHDRNERYASAAAMAEDLQRFLDARPLQAVPASRGYAMRKFAQRHRTGIAAASLVALALIGGLALSVYGLLQARAQRAIAERRSVELEKVAAFQQSMLQGIDIEAMGIGLADGLRNQLASADVADLQALERALGQASTADIARGLIDNDILANAERAIDRDFAREPALAADLRESVAHVRSALGLYEKAIGNLRNVVERRERLLGSSDRKTLAAQHALARNLVRAGQPGEAKTLAEKALDRMTDASPSDELRAELELTLSEAFGGLGDLAATKNIQSTLHERLATAIGESHPLTIRVQNNLGITIARMGGHEKARDMFQKLLVLVEAKYGPEHEDTLRALGNLATEEGTLGDFDKSMLHNRRLLEVNTRRLGERHPVTLSTRSNIALDLMDMGSLGEARFELEAVSELRKRQLGPDHPQTLRTRSDLAKLYALQKRFDLAVPIGSEVLEARKRIQGAEHPETMKAAMKYGRLLSDAGLKKQALLLLESSLPKAIARLGEKEKDVRDAMALKDQLKGH